MAEDLRLNCGEVPSSISERNAQVLKVYVIQRGQNIKGQQHCAGLVGPYSPLQRRQGGLGAIHVLPVV